MPSTTAPLGVTIIGAAAIVDALLGIATGLAVSVSGVLGLILGPVVIVLCVVQLGTAIGLIKLYSWAWTLAMVVLGLGLVVDVVNVNALGIAISVVVLGYLYTKRGLYRSGDRTVGSAHGLHD